MIRILQANIARNAAVIKKLEAEIQHYLHSARTWAKAGEKAFSIQDYKKANKLRNKLAEAVQLQRTMKVEKQAIHRQDRIEIKFKKVFGYDRMKPTQTSIEQETMLDALLAEMHPPKVDTRPADHPSHILTAAGRYAAAA